MPRGRIYQTEFKLSIQGTRENRVLARRTHIARGIYAQCLGDKSKQSSSQENDFSESNLSPVFRFGQVRIEFLPQGQIQLYRISGQAVIKKRFNDETTNKFAQAQFAKGLFGIRRLSRRDVSKTRQGNDRRIESGIDQLIYPLNFGVSVAKIFYKLSQLGL